jgi:hypothetical protein
LRTTMTALLPKLSPDVLHAARQHGVKRGTV